MTNNINQLETIWKVIAEISWEAKRQSNALFFSSSSRRTEQCLTDLSCCWMAGQPVVCGRLFSITKMHSSILRSGQRARLPLPKVNRWVLYVVRALAGKYLLPVILLRVLFYMLQTCIKQAQSMHLNYEAINNSHNAMEWNLYFSLVEIYLFLLLIMIIIMFMLFDWICGNVYVLSTASRPLHQ